VLQADDAVVQPRDRPRAVEVAGERLVQDVLDQVDLPEPDTPVTATKVPSGISKSTPCRLCARAFSTRMTRCASRGRRSGRTGICRRPDRYCAVIEFGLASTCATVPAAITSPPCFPAPVRGR
jgi:hypothetical protein